MRIITKRKFKVRVTVRNGDGSVGSLGRDYQNSNDGSEKRSHDTLIQSDESFLFSNEKQSDEQIKQEEKQKNPKYYEQKTCPEHSSYKKTCGKCCCTNRQSDSRSSKTHLRNAVAKTRGKSTNIIDINKPDYRLKSYEEIDLVDAKTSFEKKFEFEQGDFSEKGNHRELNIDKKNNSSSEESFNNFYAESDLDFLPEKGAVPKISKKLFAKSNNSIKDKNLLIEPLKETLTPSIINFSISPNHPPLTQKLHPLLPQIKEYNKNIMPELHRTTLQHEDTPKGGKKVEISMYPWGATGLGSKTNSSLVKEHTIAKNKNGFEKKQAGKIIRHMKRSFRNSQDGPVVNVSHESHLNTPDCLSNHCNSRKNSQFLKIQRHMQIRVRKNVDNDNDSTEDESTSSERESRPRRRSRKTCHEVREAKRIAKAKNTLNDIVTTSIIENNTFSSKSHKFAAKDKTPIDYINMQPSDCLDSFKYKSNSGGLNRYSRDVIPQKNVWEKQNTLENRFTNTCASGKLVQDKRSAYVNAKAEKMLDSRFWEGEESLAWKNLPEPSFSKDWGYFVQGKVDEMCHLLFYILIQNFSIILTFYKKRHLYTYLMSYHNLPKTNYILFVNLRFNAVN